MSETSNTDKTSNTPTETLEHAQAPELATETPCDGLFRFDTGPGFDLGIYADTPAPTPAPATWGRSAWGKAAWAGRAPAADPDPDVK